MLYLLTCSSNQYQLLPLTTYRAPPNVRGSGKERGHGMRLTHCPKCGTALKIGGHHVRCSAREAARQQMELAQKPSRRNVSIVAVVVFLAVPVAAFGGVK